MCGRSDELHHGQTEELMLPETSYLMLSDQLEIARPEVAAKLYPPPASQAVNVSPSDEDALSASGESRRAAIWISDDKADTEDEDDNEGQDFDHSQSCTTPMTSIADHLDQHDSPFTVVDRAAQSPIMALCNPSESYFVVHAPIWVYTREVIKAKNRE
ncbi:hypothetical protein DL767_004743 [Monosporascus sp. MG133]|nr:hypothetical protein DL767_004743 [Monosporascus sp. MG133]